MKALTMANRAKLARVLELLGSPHEGERVAAAAAAHRLVQAWGVRWEDVLATSGEPSMPPPPDHRAAQPTMSGAWKASLCLRHPGWFYPGEMDFLRAIAVRGRCLAKEAEALSQLYDRMAAMRSTEAV